MKALKLIPLIAIVFFAISCDKEDPLNQHPGAPTLTEPQNEAITGFDSVLFKWTQSNDPEGDQVRYDLQLSTDETNWETYTVYNETKYLLKPLESNTQYFWKVTARNHYVSGNKQAEEAEGNTSGTFHFFTSPPNVSELKDTVGDGFVTLTWKDAPEADYVEITFTPEVSSITQPVKIQAGTQKAEFTNLENATAYTYIVKTYNTSGHASAPDTIISMPLSPLEVRDADFNAYTVVQIGTQTWMQQNLRTTKWQDGTDMVQEYGKTLYKAGSNPELYGYHYDPSVVLEAEKNPCPCNYHIPTHEDWKTLERFLGVPESEIDIVNGVNFRGEAEDAGKLIKTTAGWNDYQGQSGNGSDMYYFRLYPAGRLSVDIYGDYEEKFTGEKAYMWSSTKNDNFVHVRIISNESTGIKSTLLNGYWYSIRCVKDTE